MTAVVTADYANNNNKTHGAIWWVEIRW